MTELVYTPSQIEGYESFASFYLDPNQTIYKLKGAAGTGKSTLIQMLLTKLPQLDRMRKLVDPSFNGMDVLMTATTNQAALSLKEATGTQHPTGTIHSALKIRPIRDYSTGVTQLKSLLKGQKIRNSLIFIDEASYIDQELLGLIFRSTENCKFVFVGDPSQLTPVTSSYMPAFDMAGPEVTLRELVRFDDGPLIQMVTNLRDTVENGNWHKFQLVPGVIEHVDRDTFLAMAEESFTKDAHLGTSKILAFHNDTVVNYNALISQRVLGNAKIQEKQRVVSNAAASNGADRLFANEEVIVKTIDYVETMGCPGYSFTFANKAGEWFMPESREIGKEAYRVAAREGDTFMMQEILESWVDMRHAWSCTVNKSQGSTYDTSFVDLTDISKGARTANQLARLLYVANGRGRRRVVMTGDIV